MRGEYNAILCGVGGQGLVLLSNVIGNACASSGLRVITGEQHGLSQRHGSVSIHMRIGTDVRSPLIPVGCGDAIVSLEAMEVLRYIEYLKDGGVVLMNSRVIHPVTDSKAVVEKKGNSSSYFDRAEIESRLRKITDNILPIDAMALAERAGNALTENMVLLGALSVFEEFPVGTDALLESIGKMVPPKAKEANAAAFKLGADASFERFCGSMSCKKR